MVRREGLEGRAVAITTMVSLSIQSFSTTRWISSWGLDIVHGIPLLLILMESMVHMSWHAFTCGSTRGKKRRTALRPEFFNFFHVKILI
jgi:hypothetical protein